jgi:hypothetical protein
LSTKEFGPGDAIINYSPAGLARFYLWVGGAGGESQGDYRYKYTSLFKNESWWNGGDDGQPGGGGYGSFYGRDPVEFKFHIGSVGRAGSQSEGTNPDGVGGLGDNGDSTTATFVINGTPITITAHGGPGGGRGNSNPSASLTPANGFPELIEWTAAAGSGLTGATVKGVKIGGNANSNTGNGRVKLQILDLE